MNKIIVSHWTVGDKITIKRLNGGTVSSGLYQSHDEKGVETNYYLDTGAVITVGDHLVATENGQTKKIVVGPRTASVLIESRSKQKTILNVPTNRLEELDEACKSKGIFRIDDIDYEPDQWQLDTGSIGG